MRNGESLERHGGYLAAASWLARDVDNETLIFRKFDALSAASLLYMQSEILELEKLTSVIFLLGPIMALNFVQNRTPKLTLISVFAILFASNIGLITTAKRAEIFAATAAYAAVLVVFVSNGELSSQETSA
ncbi:hypothetical protein K4K49_003926 [Colletotrichum sp. SAR 10_70]|nr:hypothetical protein K4K50_004699 [Colletotrichum sp. SAR 10_71]KAI8182580.1 hypothetical protein K4K51_000853 [Colletotrichum sp. SAR 10_75]KAI8198810.1 hypothetical protein K4K49_003926 [Colletotrichum sp. SAR 10_70]KAI8213795.1 hypothetical protein K4K52_003799 [Colletotrichum sp. SAR 10_76]KAI8234736.1 hypothetical protein K4K54_007810 [Colletotrichum sp. SAR 10_86]KAJ4999504.1 hypothetical protein K4K48_004030 [Colletotrichum sp. SAR 10_66]